MPSRQSLDADRCRRSGNAPSVGTRRAVARRTSRRRSAASASCCGAYGRCRRGRTPQSSTALRRGTSPRRLAAADIRTHTRRRFFSVSHSVCRRRCVRVYFADGMSATMELTMIFQTAVEARSPSFSHWSCPGRPAHSRPAYFCQNCPDRLPDLSGYGNQARTSQPAHSGSAKYLGDRWQRVVRRFLKACWDRSQ